MANSTPIWTRGRLAFHAAPNGGPLKADWPPGQPRPHCSSGSDGQRITRGTLQYRVLRAFKKAGLNGQRAPDVLVHGIRHTFATELANGSVSVYALMKLFGRESLVTSQRYVDGAGTENRAAAAQNPLYSMIEQSREPKRSYGILTRPGPSGRGYAPKHKLEFVTGPASRGF